MTTSATTQATAPSATIESILTARHSCRAFLPTQVPRTDIEQMLTLAQLTPSWCNSQPWQVHILSGEATRRLADALLDGARRGVRQPDLDPPRDYLGVYRDRRRGSGYALYNSLGIRREDTEKREEQRLENFRFFGAPHVAIITTDEQLGTYGAVDCGGYVSTLLLAAHSLGIATVPQAAIAMVSNTVREHLGIPTDRRIVCAVSFGYEDQTHPANSFRTSRAHLTEVVEWIDR
ncbi:nitroreductase [Rhodococcus pseudokoreensis]|uniref:Nitroreductase n=1 Tax=Rhodococcus pseudokoreensis TaxID=2811421 RepID=A0A974W8T3_9NOCA|nr:nitroreductase [Rhodococcus pseudokoreensis]QSE92767.1 nitroreductase [Rhodococcus pseudokoreensis]